MNEKYYPLIKYKLQRRQLQKQKEGIGKKIIYAFIHTLHNKEFKIIYIQYIVLFLLLCLEMGRAQF
jgi:hypothetical protein